MDVYGLIREMTSKAAPHAALQVKPEGEAATLMAALGFRFEVVGAEGAVLRVRVTQGAPQAAPVEHRTGFVPDGSTGETGEGAGTHIEWEYPALAGASYLVDGEDVGDVEEWLAGLPASPADRTAVLGLNQNETHVIGHHIVMRV